MLKVQVPQLAEVTYTYDNQGRLIQISQGNGAQARIITITYNQAGEVEKITNPLQQEVKFDYDAVGRILAQTLTDGRVTRHWMGIRCRWPRHSHHPTRSASSSI